MQTKVYFSFLTYGNYLDNYYVEDTDTLIEDIIQAPLISWEGNLGIQDGVSVINKFKGDFRNVNCAVIDHDIEGKCLYKIIKKEFHSRDIWTLTMVKDVISHRLQDIKNSKVLVSRLGIDRYNDNPLLLVEEPTQLSQVKTKQEFISDNVSDITGVVLFFAKDTLNNELSWEIVYEDVEVQHTIDGIENLGIQDTTFSDGYNVWTGGSTYTSSYSTTRYTVQAVSVPKYSYEVGLYGGNMSSYEDVENYSTSDRYGIDMEPSGSFISFEPDITLSRIKNNMENYRVPLYADDTGVYKNGDIVKDTSTDKYYRISRTSTLTTNVTSLGVSDSWVMVTNQSYYTGNLINNFRVIRKEHEVHYTLTEITSGSEVRYHTLNKQESCKDQPYDIVYVPIKQGLKVVYEGNEYELLDDVIMANMYALISKNYGENGALIDAQLVSYSPVDFDNHIVDGNLYLDNLELNNVCIEDDYAIIFMPVYNADYYKEIEMNIEVEDYKLEQKKKYILSSPTGSSNYEFEPYKNGGLEKLLVNINLRPYASYYRIQPLYNNFYGENYNDTRGLIWQEDNSLTLTSDAWETYKRQNINYLNSFNTNVDYETSNLALQHDANKMNYTYDSGKRILEGITSAISTGIFGGMASGAGGAIAGTVGVLGAAGISEGIEYKQMLANNRAEVGILDNTLANSRMQFNYSVGNIRALPENTGKVSGVFSSRNVYAYIQYFEPTQNEKDYYVSYLDTVGVNVGMLVDLNNEEFNYLQGTILAFNSAITIEEYQEIFDKLSKGIRRVI